MPRAPAGAFSIERQALRLVAAYGTRPRRCAGRGEEPRGARPGLRAGADRSRGALPHEQGMGALPRGHPVAADQAWADHAARRTARRWRRSWRKERRSSKAERGKSLIPVRAPTASAVSFPRGIAAAGIMAEEDAPRDGSACGKGRAAGRADATLRQKLRRQILSQIAAWRRQRIEGDVPTALGHVADATWRRHEGQLDDRLEP